MSATFDSTPFSTDLDAAIDRLVAGELAADRRRALLLHLEATPDAWRRCALGFLEDQAWRTALAQPQAAIVPQPKPEAGLQGTRANRALRYALAASILMLFASACFSAGIASGRRSGSAEVVKLAPELKIEAVPTPDPVAEPGQPLGYLSVVDPSQGEALPRRIPVLAATESNARWLEAQPSKMSAYVRAQWERRGYQVEEHRRLVGLNTKEGQQVAIPVDEVALDYVGRRPL